MTYEEAIEYISERYVTMSMCLTLDECRKHNKAISMAIEALEKQIPKKPRRTNDGLSIAKKDFYTKCQLCNHNFPVVVRKGRMRFCPFCGQAIDWEDYE